MDASRYGLVADGVTDNTAKLQAALSTCPAGGTVYVPPVPTAPKACFCRAARRCISKRAARCWAAPTALTTPFCRCSPCHNEKDEHYLGLWSNPLDSFAGLINVINAENVTITGEGTIDANAQNGDWYQNPKEKNIAWRPRLFFTSGAKNVVLHGVLSATAIPGPSTDLLRECGHPEHPHPQQLHEPQHRRHRPRELQECQHHRQPCTRR